MITYGSGTVYTSFDKNAKVRLPMKVNDAIESLTKKPLPKGKLFLPLGESGNDAEGTDCTLPDVRYQI